MKNEKGLNVLLIEEDQLNAEVLKKVIRSHAKIENLVLRTTPETENVLDEIKRSEIKPNLIILSEPLQGKIKFTNQLPMQLKEIKRASPLSEVIVLTTPYKVESILEMFRSGAYDVIFKDEFTSRNVANTLNRFLSSEKVEGAVVKQKVMASIY